MSTVFPVTEWVWADGEVVPWKDATLHVMSHVVHYGSSVFEGIRAYASDQGPMYFRYPEHMRRLRESAGIYRMQLRLDGRRAQSRNQRPDCPERPQ